MKLKKTILDRGQDYKFANLHYVKGTNHIWNDSTFMKQVKSAYALYSVDNPQSLMTADDMFCDHFAKKCNGRKAIDKAIAIETIRLVSCMTHEELKGLRGHYGYTNKDIMRAVTGRPVSGSAAVGNKAVQAEQVDNIINYLRQKCGKAQSAANYIGGKLSTENKSDDFKALAKKVHKAHKTLNDSRELKLLKDAHRINEGFDKGIYDGIGKLIPKKDRVKPAPKTTKTAQSKTA